MVKLKIPKVDGKPEVDIKEMLLHCYRYCIKIEDTDEYELWETDSPIAKGKCPDHLAIKDSKGNITKIPDVVKKAIDEVKKYVVS